MGPLLHLMLSMPQSFEQRCVMLTMGFCRRFGLLAQCIDFRI